MNGIDIFLIAVVAVLFLLSTGAFKKRAKNGCCGNGQRCGACKQGLGCIEKSK